MNPSAAAGRKGWGKGLDGRVLPEIAKAERPQEMRYATMHGSFAISLRRPYTAAAPRLSRNCALHTELAIVKCQILTMYYSVPSFQ